MTPETGLVAMVGMALFHATTHLALHDAKDKFERFIDRPERLKNSDVQKAVQQTLKVVSRRLHAEYRDSHPEDPSAEATFKALERYVPGPHENQHADPDLWLSSSHVAGATNRLVDALCPAAPPGLKQFLYERFPPLFVFAFREIGLKGNEKVRAVVFESMLHRLADDNKRVQAMLLTSDQALQSGLERMGCELAGARGQLSDLLDELRGFKVLVNLGLLGEGPVLAYVRVDDPQGNTLRTESIRNRKFTIGRGGRERGVAIHLDHSDVSRQHAAITLDAAGAIVEDLKGTHGTLVEGEKLVGPQRVAFGTVIRIGPFQVAVLSPHAEAHELMTAVTQPL